jgi:hypothetical protein
VQSAHHREQLNTCTHGGGGGGAAMDMGSWGRTNKDGRSSRCRSGDITTLRLLEVEPRELTLRASSVSSPRPRSRSGRGGAAASSCQPSDGIVGG